MTLCTTPLFPTDLPVSILGHKAALTSTRVSKHVSGRTVRIELYSQPMFQFEIAYEGLATGAAFQGLPAQSMQELLGFFTDRGGPAEPFLYWDDEDNYAQGQLLGAGNGLRTGFTFLWPWGRRDLPVGQVEPEGLTVYLGGVAQPASTYSVSGYNSLVFNSAPGVGVEVTADYTYYFLCCFDDDVMDFQRFLSRLWTCQSIKFTTFKP